MKIFYILIILFFLKQISSYFTNTTIIGYKNYTKSCSYCCETKTKCEMVYKSRHHHKKCKDYCSARCYYTCYDIYTINQYKNESNYYHNCNYKVCDNCNPLNYSMYDVEKNYPINKTIQLYVDEKKNLCYTNGSFKNNINIYTIFIIVIASVIFIY